MTGKEALIRVSKSCSGLALEFGNLKIGKTDNEALQTLKEIVQKYDKYKRAFEILKREKNVTLEKMSFDDYYLYYIIYYGTYSDEITKEEYELLEELMNGEETQN